MMPGNVKFRIAVVVVAALLGIFFYGYMDYSDTVFKNWDWQQYYKMAVSFPQIDTTVERPFAFRLAGPFLAGALPIDPATGFRILSGIGLVATAVGYFIFLRHLKVGDNSALLAAIFYIANKHFFGFASWNYFHLNDIIINLVFLMAFLALYERKWPVFAIALMVGAATREIFIIMIPTASIFLLWDLKKPSDLRRLLIASVPAVVLFILIRFLIKPGAGPTLMSSLSGNYVKFLSLKGIFHQFINPFMPLTLIPVIFYKETLRFFGERIHLLVFLALVFLCSLFGENSERLVHPGFIVFYFLLVTILNDRVKSKAMTALIICVSILGSLHYMIARYPLPSRNMTILISGGGAILLPLALLRCKYRAKPQKTFSSLSI